jgi:Kef-type K+ transport system membrane component KefB
MKNEYSIKDKLILCLLATGAFCFGVLLPDSFSDHDKLVHFSAHFGMSCLLALCFYMICTVKMRISKSIAYMILITATLFIGIVYKFWEIGTSGMTGNYSFHTILDTKGVAISMSQNISGLLGAIFLIEGLVDRNLVMSVHKHVNVQSEKSFSLSSEN